MQHRGIRRCGAVLFAALLLLSVVQGMAEEEATVQRDGIAYRIEGGEAVVVGSEGEMRSVLMIPAEVDGVPVVGIGRRAFFDNKQLWTVILPETIRYIDEDAFGESSLRGITLNDGLQSIEEGAFAYSRLTNVYIPRTVERIERAAFFECTDLRSVYIAANLQTIKDYTFFECISLYDVHLPDSLETIEDYAFYFCISIWDINLPANLTKVGGGAFYDVEAVEDWGIEQYEDEEEYDWES